jgi:hypothetical protein
MSPEVGSGGTRGGPGKVFTTSRYCVIDSEQPAPTLTSNFGALDTCHISGLELVDDICWAHPVISPRSTKAIPTPTAPDAHFIHVWTVAVLDWFPWHQRRKPKVAPETLSERPGGERFHRTRMEAQRYRLRRPPLAATRTDRPGLHDLVNTSASPCSAAAPCDDFGQGRAEIRSGQEPRISIAPLPCRSQPNAVRHRHVSDGARCRRITVAGGESRRSRRRSLRSGQIYRAVPRT